MEQKVLSFKIICIMIIFKNSVTSEIIKDNNLGKLSNINESFYQSNKSKSNIHSEIDSVLPNLEKDIKLPKDKLDILLSLDNEMGKSKQKSIVPRKGVHSSIEDIQVFRNSTNHKENSAINTLMELKNREENIYNLKNATSSGEGKLMSVGLMSNENIEKNISHTVNKTEVPKKPLILSNEGLDKITLIESDQNYIKENQITKVPKNPNSHPGMITPIVITMLVVPMFAVVAYLAVKRGQEAWKNRHYKRMDFLLDGMYND